MNIIPNEQDKISIGGQTFIAPLENAAFKVLTGNFGQTTNWATLREMGSSSGYQVPTGSVFKIVAGRFVIGSVAGPVRIAYGDNDVGMPTGTTPTNATFPGADVSNGTVLQAPTALMNYETGIAPFLVPATKFPAVAGPGGGGGTIATCFIYGYEVPA